MVKFTPIFFRFPFLQLGDLPHPLMLLKNPACCIKSECHEKKQKRTWKEQMCDVINIDKYDVIIQLDNTKAHSHVQASHQNKIKKWCKEAPAKGYGSCN